MHDVKPSQSIHHIWNVWLTGMHFEGVGTMCDLASMLIKGVGTMCDLASMLIKGVGTMCDWQVCCWYQCGQACV